MSMYQYNYRTSVDLYNNPETKEGYVATLNFKILMGDISKIIVNETPIQEGAYFSVRIYRKSYATALAIAQGYVAQGETGEYDITDSIGVPFITQDLILEISVYQLADNEIDMVSNGYITKVLPVPAKVELTTPNPNPNSNETIRINWSDEGCSSEPVNFPIKGYYLNIFGYKANASQATRLNQYFGESVTINGENIKDAILTTNNYYDFNLLKIINIKEFHRINIGIQPYLEWDDTSDASYTKPLIFPRAMVDTIDIYPQFTSNILMFIKNTNGKWVQGNALFIKNNDTWVEGSIFNTTSLI